MSAIDTGVVSDALQELYNPSSSPRSRRRADSLLQRFQRSPEAAQTSLRVLRDAIVDANAAPQIVAALKAERAFAASTIYFTVSSYVRKYRLDEATHWTDEERDMHAAVTKEFGEICQDVWNILTGPNASQEESNVQTHLALTVAVILLRFHDIRAENTVVSAVEWLVQNQETPMNDDQTAAITNYAILLALKVMPEEVENRRVKFSKNKRMECQLMVEQSTAHVLRNVLPTISASIDASGSQARLRGPMLKCLASWVEYGRIPPNLLLESPLVDRCFQEIMNPTFSDDALSAIREIVRACTTDAYVPLMERMMRNFVLLGKHIIEQGNAQEDVTFCLKGCARAISECGQTFVMYFVDYTLDLQPDSLVYQFLDTIMFFTSSNDLETSNETMDFWVDFRAYVSGKNEERIQLFDVFISRLICILVERTEFPADYESLPSAAKDRFAGYRNDVRAVFRSLAKVTAASEEKFISDASQVIFKQYELAESNEITPDWWRKTEVYVHALSALSKSIRQDDRVLIPKLLDYLSREEPSHRALSRTITIFLGVIGDWFAQNPQYLEVYAYKILSKSFTLSQEHKAYPFRMRGQEDHVGAVALRKLTKRCGAHFFTQRWLESLLNLYRGNHFNSSSNRCMDSASVMLVVESIAEIVGSVSYQEALPVVEELAGIMFHDLATRHTDFNPEDEESVDYLVTLFEHLQVMTTMIPARTNQTIQHPVLCVLQSHWKVLEAVLRVYGAVEEIAEKFCAAMVGIFDSLRGQAVELASAMMPHLLEQFSRSHDGNYLLVIKSILSCAGSDSESMVNLTRVLVIVTEDALSHIAALGNVDENPYLLVALFELISLCGTQRPLILVQSNQLESLLNLTLHALKAQNPDVASATLKFLLEIGSWYGEVVRTPQDMLKGPAMEGKVALFHVVQNLFFERDLQYHLLVGLFHAAGGGMPPTMLENIAEVLRSCWSFFGKQRTEELILRVLADDGFLGPYVAAKARGEFAQNISKPECIENSRKFRRVLSSFCDHYRKSLSANLNSAGLAS